MSPAGVILPMASPMSSSVNQTLPSGPPTMSEGVLCGCGSGNSVIVGAELLPPNASSATVASHTQSRLPRRLVLEIATAKGYATSCQSAPLADQCAQVSVESALVRLRSL